MLDLPTATMENKKAESASIGFRLPDESSYLKPAFILYATEGWGKTSTGAFVDGAVFICAPQETGYLTLRRSARVPERQYLIAQTWNELLQAVRNIPANTKLLVLDALGGFERLCHEHVCKTQFKGKFGEDGFMSYHKGYTIALQDWQQLLLALDGPRQSGTVVLILGHARIIPFKNPEGPDYDRYACDCHEKTWGLTHKWADAVFFGQFLQALTEEKKGRVKGAVDPAMRILRTERTDAWDAKNRFGMPDTIDIPDDPAQVWPTIINSTKKGQCK